MKLSWNSTVLIVAPSNSGKTVLTTEIVLRRNQLFDKESQLCLWYYEAEESIPKQLKDRPDVICKQGLPELDELKKFAHLRPLVVIDDQMTRLDKEPQKCERIVSVLTHHLDMTVVFLLHSIFYSKTVRNLRLNCNYLIIFKNPTDKLSIRCLGSQLMPGRVKSFVAIYEAVTEKPYSYLVIDLTKDCPEELRLRDGIFPDNVIHAYVPS